jgi:formylglycine-generating enzyme required for sulfatase activity
MMQHAKHIFLMIWLLLLLGVLSAFSQQLTFHVVSFAEDPFDLTARNDQYKKIDGSGSLYAVIKVGSTNPEGLREYNFNFGNMNHLVEWHDGKLWVYVQKNAKMVTIMRPGYTTVDRYDLHTTIESGKTYVMQLSEQAPVIMTQMVMFQVKPADARATVMIRREAAGAQEEVFGITDAEGSVAKTREYGTYTYRVMAENYHNTEGRFTLDNRGETHIENVSLRRNGANVTLSVASDADIYVNDQKRGTRSWTGLLRAGTYQVECRQQNHRSSFRTITVEEDKDAAVTLTPPAPVTGTLAVNSSPLRATIKIDGKDYGQTPKMLSDVLIGRHTLTLSREGYEDARTTIEIAEQQTTDVNLTLKEKPKATTPSVGGTPNASGGRTFTVNGVSFVMMPVEGGTFQMGATAEQGNDAYEWEKPAHSVTLSSYSIGQTEVTQALWQAVMGSNPSKWIGDNLPVEQVSWNDCQTFITKLNQLTGQKFRLPTEAEWEFAARGGRQSKGYKYSGSNTLADVAWYDDNSGRKTHPVATKQPNELGLYDMSGNVYEWCQDWYYSNYYSSSPSNNPTGPSSGSYRVSRGGSWYYFARSWRVSYRISSKPSDAGSHRGFRLALSVQP